MLKSMAALIGLLLVSQAALAEGSAKLVGTWKLVSYETQFKETGAARPDFGSNPVGYVIFTAEGRVIGVIEAEGRAVPKTNEERVKAFPTTVAYSGTYVLNGDKWTTYVDVSSNPAWRGKETVRTATIEGDKLHVATDWAPNPNYDGQVTRNVLKWLRVK
jgi:hypothetical protein